MPVHKCIYGTTYDNVRKCPAAVSTFVVAIRYSGRHTKFYRPWLAYDVYSPPTSIYSLRTVLAKVLPENKKELKASVAAGSYSDKRQRSAGKQ